MNLIRRIRLDWLQPLPEPLPAPLPCSDHVDTVDDDDEPTAPIQAPALLLESPAGILYGIGGAMDAPRRG